jgi:hypothetical protein
MNKSVVTIVGTTVVVASVIAATLPHPNNNNSLSEKYPGVDSWGKYWILGTVHKIVEESKATGVINSNILQNLQETSKNSDNALEVSDKLKQIAAMVSAQVDTEQKIVDGTKQQVVKGQTLEDLTQENHSLLAQVLSASNQQRDAIASLSDYLNKIVDTTATVIQLNQKAEALLKQAAQLSTEAANDISIP